MSRPPMKRSAHWIMLLKPGTPLGRRGLPERVGNTVQRREAGRVRERGLGLHGHHTVRLDQEPAFVAAYVSTGTYTFVPGQSFDGSVNAYPEFPPAIAPVNVTILAVAWMTPCLLLLMWIPPERPVWTDFS